MREKETSECKIMQGEMHSLNLIRMRYDSKDKSEVLLADTRGKPLPPRQQRQKMLSHKV